MVAVLIWPRPTASSGWTEPALSQSELKSSAKSPDSTHGLDRPSLTATSTAHLAQSAETKGLAGNSSHVSPVGPGPVLARDALFPAGKDSSSQIALVVPNAASSTIIPTGSSPTNQVAGGGAAPLEVVVPVVQSGEGLTIPASLANPSVETALVPTSEEGVEQLADEFAHRLADEGVSPESPQYLQAWEDAAWLSDLQFKARYGQQAWMQRHVQAHHQNREEQGGEP